MKAIETYYNGYKFRSRLEARWAVFFDALGVKYEYEPEGFDLGDGMYYLPDFRVKCWGTRGDILDKPFDLWIEVKGYMTKEDANKIHKFAGEWIEGKGMENPILIVSQIPDNGCSYDEYELHAGEGMDESDICPFNYELIDGDYFPAYPAALNGKFYLWGNDSNYIHDIQIVEDAYEKARQARFEYGDAPNPIRKFYTIIDNSDRNIIIRHKDNGFTVYHPYYSHKGEVEFSLSACQILVNSVCGSKETVKFADWIIQNGWVVE